MLRWAIIYCSPKQIDPVMRIVNDFDLFAHRFTMEEGVVPMPDSGGLSERDYILTKFTDGYYKILVAMKCLDEGIDIPAAREAVLMCSSGNPREYIQRIGRILRRCEGKDQADLHDIIVVPSLSDLPPELRKVERSVFRKELARCREIAILANNSADALSALDDVILRFGGTTP